MTPEQYKDNQVAIDAIKESKYTIKQLLLVNGGDKHVQEEVCYIQKTIDEHMAALWCSNTIH